MGWGNKGIEIRSVETGQMDGIFMHKKTQKLRFLCERNDKVRVGMYLEVPALYHVAPLSLSLLYSLLPSPPQVFFASIKSSSNSQVYFMALNRRLPAK